MSSITPTIRITREIFLSSKGDFLEAGYSPDKLIEEALQQFEDFYGKDRLSDAVDFSMDIVEVILTGDILHDFESTITGRFVLNGILHLVLATGDVFPVEFDYDS